MPTVSPKGLSRNNYYIMHLIFRPSLAEPQSERLICNTYSVTDPRPPQSSVPGPDNSEIFDDKVLQ